MRRYSAYLKYVLRHKWFVMLECFKRKLYWRGIKHDISKLLPSEFIPYAKFFYNSDGSKRDIRDESGYYKPTDTGNAAFDMAWLHHQKWNDHHWQWWILPEDEGGVKVMDMSMVAMMEMISDWAGAGRAISGETNPWNWYEQNRDKMQLSQTTKDAIHIMMMHWYNRDSLKDEACATCKHLMPLHSGFGTCTLADNTPVSGNPLCDEWEACECSKGQI